MMEDQVRSYAPSLCFDIANLRGSRRTNERELVISEEISERSLVYEVLIYISYKYQSPGQIRDEYVARMQLAIADARAVGVSDEYLETSLCHLVSESAG